MSGTGRAAGTLFSALAAVLLIALPILSSPASSTELDFGGDARLFLFQSSDGIEEQSEDAQLGLLRLKLDTFFSDEVRIEVHGVLELTSPPRVGGRTSIATGDTRQLLDLEKELFEEGEVRGTVELDRLNLRWERPHFRLVAGRQAITWGVNYFWPALDLFAPFAPERIDRDYKPGVDALRVTVPLGSFSEVELVAAAQGERTPDDLSFASLGRFHAGRTDFGYMVGSFHEDTVLGAFVTADVRGSGVRAEVAFTDSGDPLDQDIAGESFWRASLGFDRQLTGRLTLTAESAFNGFGTEDASEYLRLSGADRVQRGEITSFGRWYGVLSLAWMAHPLVSVSGAVLYNVSDGSTLLQPAVNWSLSDALVAQGGLLIGIGPGLTPVGELESEYGAVPLTLWLAVKAFF